MSIDREIDKEDMAYIYNGILLSHKKEQNWLICNEVDGPRVCHREWSKSEIEKQIPYANEHIWNLKNGTDEPSGRTGIKMQSFLFGTFCFVDLWWCSVYKIMLFLNKDRFFLFFLWAFCFFFLPYTLC